jgi:hypothetical protein
MLSKSADPVLDPTEAGVLLDSIDVTTQAGLRDRAFGHSPASAPWWRCGWRIISPTASADGRASTKDGLLGHLLPVFIGRYLSGVFI